MDKIRSGEWHTDQMIPTEKEFCAAFGVSRQTVRTALQKLVYDGYLVRTKGKGTFVSKPKTLERSSIFIESFAEEMKQQGLIIKTEVLEFRVISAPAEVLKCLKIPSEKEVIKLTRLRYVKGSFDKGPIVLSTSYYPARLSFILKQDLEQVSMHQVFESQGITRKFLEKELFVITLGLKESLLLGQTRDAPAMFIKSLAWDQNNQPLEYSESCYPAERNRFILRVQV
jgi:GntR family transcriptional regulator